MRYPREAGKSQFLAAAHAADAAKEKVEASDLPPESRAENLRWVKHFISKIKNPVEYLSLKLKFAGRLAAIDPDEAWIMFAKTKDDLLIAVEGGSPSFQQLLDSLPLTEFEILLQMAKRKNPDQVLLFAQRLLPEIKGKLLIEAIRRLAIAEASVKLERATKTAQLLEKIMMAEDYRMLMIDLAKIYAPFDSSKAKNILSELRAKTSPIEEKIHHAILVASVELEPDLGLGIDAAFASAYSFEEPVEQIDALLMLAHLNPQALEFAKEINKNMSLDGSVGRVFEIAYKVLDIDPEQAIIMGATSDSYLLGYLERIIQKLAPQNLPLAALLSLATYNLRLTRPSLLPAAMRHNPTIAKELIERPPYDDFINSLDELADALFAIVDGSTH